MRTGLLPPRVCSFKGFVMMTNKKHLIWLLLSLMLAMLSLWAVLMQSGDMPLRQLWEEVWEAEPGCLFAAVLCGALFLLLEGQALRCILKAAGYRRSFPKGTVYSAADIYFSAITPSASGGQPASAVFMIRDGIPSGVVTATLIVNLILYTVSIVLLGLLAALTHFHLLLVFRPLSRALILIGAVLLSGLTLFFFLMLGNGEKVFGAVAGFYRFLAKHRIIHRLDHRLDRLERAKVEYRDCIRLVREKPRLIVKAFLYNFAQRAAQIAVPMFVYLGMGGRAGNVPTIFASQCFITIGYNCVPVPGGMGVADFLMVDAFSDLMALEDALHLELLSRSIAFYICVAASGIIVLVSTILRRKRRGVKSR